MGQEEHDANSRVTPGGEDEVRVDDDYDSEEEVKESVMIDKSKEQLTEEAIQRWHLFAYHKWALQIIVLLFLCSLVNLVLTLDQWHGTHSWRYPFDLYPSITLPGGWDDEGGRWFAAILGIVAACFTFVLSPTADKFKFMFVLVFVSATLHVVQFGTDLFHLNSAVDSPECVARERGNAMEIRKYICVFDRFRATVIFDIITGVFSYFLAFFILYQSVTGVVSRRQVYNERSGNWEKIVLLPDDPYYEAFPKRFMKQRPPFVLLCIFVGVCNAVVLALTITQTSSEYFKSPNMLHPIKNYEENTARDLYILPGDQPWGVGHGLGTGSWPLLNFELRLSANALALVVLSFLIQWRRDGRFAQICVLTLLLAAGAIYIACFFVDFDEYDHSYDQGDAWATAKGATVVRHRYIATLIFDCFCGFGLLIFSVINLFRYIKQCGDPINKTDSRPYGWWCRGEWAAKKESKAANKALAAGVDDEAPIGSTEPAAETK